MAEIWIDTDAGFDDLLAIQMVARAAGVSVAGLSLVAGNAELGQVIDNARAMAATLGWQFPVFAGAEKPLAQTLDPPADILGPRGLKTAGLWFDDARAGLAPEPAVDALADWLAARDKPAAILALGPLTNLALLVSRRPDLRGRISELVIMGGSTDRGNATAAAEFNIHADPEAASRVFAAGVKLKMIGLNVCRQVELVPSDIQALADLGTARGRLVADLLAGYLSIRDPECRQPMALYDPVAAAALLNPDCLRWEAAHVAVELDGALTRGMTVCEFRVPQKAAANALVGMAADANAIRQLVFAALGVNVETLSPGRP
ncbi:Inosine-uridine preferring nucleoside hydrolase [hydrothermal vent metagenome]|uniref:Inosine-uridine preferring nucleoside hydrolase n=1 Tax=hydrothermal vent metagenome TaxID=652676 RepID=A0A3B0TXU7_9ZZZZ